MTSNGGWLTLINPWETASVAREAKKALVGFQTSGLLSVRKWLCTWSEADWASTQSMIMNTSSGWQSARPGQSF
jgi:hypothetical protein